MAEPTTTEPAPVALDLFPEPTLPALFRAAVGPVSAERYVPLFGRLEAGDQTGPSWNWAAGLCTLNWMIFRRLWLPAGLYAVALLVLPLLLVGTGRLLLHWSDVTELVALAGFGLLTLVLPALWGDRLLYQYCRNDITRALSSQPTLQAACDALARNAANPGWLKRQQVVSAVLAVGALALWGYLFWSGTPAEEITQTPTLPIEPAAPRVNPASATRPASSESILAATSSPLQEPASAAIMAEPAASGNMPPASPASAPVSPATTVTPASGPEQVFAPPQALPINKTSATAPRATPSSAGQRGYHVNVGLFADPDNARRAYVKLVKAGVPAQREVMLIKDQRVTRVRAGPFTTRAKARAAIARIIALQLDAELAKP